jgi:hypothetical protein
VSCGIASPLPLSGDSTAFEVRCGSLSEAPAATFPAVPATLVWSALTDELDATEPARSSLGTGRITVSPSAPSDSALPALSFALVPLAATPPPVGKESSVSTAIASAASSAESTAVSDSSERLDGVKRELASDHPISHSSATACCMQLPTHCGTSERIRVRACAPNVPARGRESEGEVGTAVDGIDAVGSVSARHGMASRASATGLSCMP